MKNILLLRIVLPSCLFLLTGFHCIWGQVDSVHIDSAGRADPNYKLLRGIFAGQSALYLGTMYGLSKAWYKQPLKSFTIKDDTYEWLQMDKMGHVYTSYQIARLTASIYKNTGISKKQMIVYGAVSGIIFQTPIEILDGFSPDYGFSPGDMAANISGSVLYFGQMALWDEIRIQPKFSTHLTAYASVRPSLLGETYPERILKDYNGQTYWLSASPAAFTKNSKWPAWLCLSIGYGINNMVYSEVGKSSTMGYAPNRELYLSLDIDLTKIKAKNKVLKTLAFVLNTVKIPAPAVRFGGKGVKFSPIYF